MKKLIAILLALLLAFGLAACDGWASRPTEVEEDPMHENYIYAYIDSDYDYGDGARLVREFVAGEWSGRSFILDELPDGAELYDTIEIVTADPLPEANSDDPMSSYAEILRVSIAEKFIPEEPAITVSAGGETITPWLEYGISKRYDSENGLAPVYGGSFISPVKQLIERGETIPELTYADDLAITYAENVSEKTETSIMDETYEYIADSPDFAALDPGSYYIMVWANFSGTNIVGDPYEQNAYGYFKLIVPEK